MMIGTCLYDRIHKNTPTIYELYHFIQRSNIQESIPFLTIILPKSLILYLELSFRHPQYKTPSYQLTVSKKLILSRIQISIKSIRTFCFSFWAKKYAKSMNNYEILKMSKLLQSLSRILDLRILHFKSSYLAFLLSTIFIITILCQGVSKNKIIVIGGWGSVPKR